MRIRLTLSFIALLLCLAYGVTGSPGDRNAVYKFYLNECVNVECPKQAAEMLHRYNHSGIVYDISPIPNRVTAFLTQLFWWSCYDECRYSSMWKHVEYRLQNNLTLQQYYGKWPFVRLLGMQEPASVLFSVINGFQHYRYLRKMIRLNPRECSRMRLLYIVNASIAVILWIFSSLFHWRDFPITEKLDYFGAGGHVIFSSYVGTVRILNIRRRQKLLALLALCAALYLAHVSYLSFWKFDYGYNMKANIVVGLYHTVIWTLWAARQWRTKPHTRIMLFASIGIALSMVLEVFDFSPLWFTVDAHALWHLSTALIVPYYEKFFYVDMLVDGSRGANHPALKGEIPSWARARRTKTPY